MVHHQIISRFIQRCGDLNTSYVMVHRVTWISRTAASTYLNTSYVMVHHLNLPLQKNRMLYLNTSYVMVHRYVAIPVTTICKFKYILCYGSSLADEVAEYNKTVFKYILCYGSSMMRWRMENKILQFKYILCYGSS